MTRTQPFGRYELLDRVSAGGMAEVFRARDTERGTVVALKRILPQVAEDEEFIWMLKDEARICAQLEHPHIARTLDFGHVDGEYFIAFEYVDGRDLRQIFDRAIRSGERVPLGVVLYLFARIGEGLSYAHHRKDPSGETISLVHRDVSPQNIVVSFNGDVKLIDFGIAKARGKMTRTEAGTIKGKFGYMSPEQVGGLDIDHRADIFALGVCLWELLTMRRLYAADNELQVLDKIRTMTVPPPSAMNPEVGPELDRIVKRALARDVGERYRAAKEFYREVNALPESAGTRDEIASYMRRTFPELAQGRPGLLPLPLAPPRRASGAPPPSSVRNGHGGGVMNRVDAGQPVGQKAARQESSIMAAGDNKGSDLDIFEGLGKKGAATRASSVPAPPPPSRRSASPAAGEPANGEVKKTLTGVSAPPPPPAATSPSGRPAPPPPPGRGSLPPIAPPPAKSSASAPPAAAAPAAPAPAPSPSATARTPASPSSSKKGEGGGLDMDWDDENEATHVYDKSESKVAAAPVAPGSEVEPPPPSARNVGKSQRPAPANGVALAPPPPPPPPPASMRPPAPPPPTSQGGIRASAPPPLRTSAPPPPPPSAGAFARASSVPSAAPGPIPQSPSTAPLAMPGSPSSPPQGTTAPMVMPSRPPPAHTTSAPPPAQAQSIPRSMEATALVRPPPSRTGAYVALAAAFTAVVAGAVFFLTTPRTGRVVVNVNDPQGAAVNHVEIFVDGKKWCDTTPCIVDPVNAGNHEVKVLADGFEVPAPRAIAVEARKESQLAFALAPSAARGGTGVKVSGSQPGVKLFVDDKEIGPLPTEVRSLDPGSHKVRLVGSERYQPLEKSITIAKDEVLDLGQQQLKVLKGKITVTLSTPGAKVYIVSGADRRELPILPISVDIDTSKTWQLEATRPGSADFRLPITFDDGQAEKTIAISLDARGPTTAALPPGPTPVAPPPAVAEAPKPAPVAPAAPPSPGPLTAIAETPKPTPPAAPKPTPAPAPIAAVAAGASEAASGESFLDINSIPVSSVLLDGKPIGTTPKLHVSVSPGSHTVVFVNADQGLKKTLQVSVGAGESKKAIAKLKD